jgi:hypothetical protein
MKISELPAVKFLIIASIGYLIGNFFVFNEFTLFLFLCIAILLFCAFLLLKRKELAYFFSVILCGVYFFWNCIEHYNKHSRQDYTGISCSIQRENYEDFEPKG